MTDANEVVGAIHRRQCRSSEAPRNKSRQAGICEYNFSGLPLDYLTTALCISIGTGVPWLMAIYSDNGARQLFGNSVFGLLGTALAALVFDWISPTYSVITLLSVGPVIALLTIFAGQAVSARSFQSSQKARRSYLAGLAFHKVRLLSAVPNERAAQTFCRTFACELLQTTAITWQTYNPAAQRLRVARST